jgi:hypothetical protein
LWEYFNFDFALVQHVALQCLLWTLALAQLYPAALAGGMSQSVLSLSFFDVYVLNKGVAVNPRKVRLKQLRLALLNTF